MGKRANGGVLGVVNTPTTNKASGLWSLAEVALYKKAGTWPSIATFALSVDSASVNKGGSFTVTLTTTGVADGTLVPYEITGIAAEDLSSGSLTGNFTVTSNTGSLTFTTASSGGTSGNLTATFTCGGDTETITFQEGDTYFKYVTALLHGDGTNAANNNSFTDSSTNAFSITRNGDTTQGTFTPYGDTWSNYFGGDGSALTFPTNTAFAFGTGDVTIEAWIFDDGTTAAYGQIIGASTYGSGNEFLFSLNGSTRTLFAQFGSSGGASSTGTVAVSTWTHVALVRSGSTVTFYINGVSGGSYTDSDSVSSTITPTIGTSSNNNSDARFKGYISNLRITKGGALYTGSFTPSTTSLTTTVASGTVSLLTCQSNRFKDNSTNAFAITVGGSPSVQKFSPFSPTAAYSTSGLGGSAYFDDSGDYLTTSSSAVSYTGDFCIEGWFYTNTTKSYACIYSDENTGVGTTLMINNGSNNGQLTFYGGSISNLASTRTGFNNNAWHHFAITRSGSTVRLFVNGVLENSATASGTLTTPSTFRVGTSFFSSRDFLGYISDFRVVSGSAVYTTAFTPPTTPLTAITNTSLLLNFTNGGIIDNAMMNDWVTVGDVQVNTTTKKYGSGSLKFDGTGDYLKGNAQLAGLTGSGDFTIEGWAYIASLPNAEVSFCSTCENGGTGIIFGLGGGGNVNKLQFAIGNLSTGNPTVVDTVNFTTGAWVHFAAVRYNGTIYLYKNGTSVGTPTSATGTLERPTVTVGAWPSGSSPLNGYIDELRVSKFARYTSNFTAPTGAFQDR